MIGPTLAAFLLLFQAAGNPAQSPQQLQPRKASVEGVVTSVVSGEPLMRAQVVLQRIQPPTAAATGPIIVSSTITTSAQIPALITERDGKFEFKNLEPGQYRLRVTRNGYAPQEYGQRTVTTSGIPITLVEGQELKGVAFKLIAAGVVSGRVRDANGEPVGRVQVSLMRSVYSVNGQRAFNSVGSDTTDDRGEYRIFWVPPGRYIVSVSSNNSSLPIEVIVINQQYSDRTFPPTYYPGTTDPVRATTLELQAGAEIAGVDFNIATPKAYRIRGRMVDSTTGQPPRSANINVTARQDQNISVLLPLNTGASSSYNSADGTFEVRNVVPGSYWIRGQASVNSADPIDRNLIAQARTNSDLIDLALLGGRGASTQVPIEVGTQDLEGVVLTLSPGVNIPIQLSVEGQELMAVPNYDRIRVYLRPTTNSNSTGNQRLGFSPEGTANIENVSPGEYRLNVSTPQLLDYFVKEARFERMDVLNDPWQISNQTSGTLSIILSPRAGLIEGSVTDALSKPVGGNPVVLVPDLGRDRTELFKSVTTDANGRFTMRGVYPGGYRLYSWEALESNAYFDRDVLSQYESQGTPIRIQEGSKENVNLKLILVKQ